jgi:hypothetical protein
VATSWPAMLSSSSMIHMKESAVWVDQAKWTLLAKAALRASCLAFSGPCAGHKRSHYRAAGSVDSSVACMLVQLALLSAAGT